MMKVENNPDSFVASHLPLKESAMHILQHANAIPIPKLLDEFVDTLESQIDSALSAKLNTLFKMKCLEEIKIKKITEKAHKNYEVSMQQFMNTNYNPFDHLKWKQTQALLNRNVESIVQYYRIQMKSRSQGKILLEEEFETVHSQVYQDCLHKLSENLPSSRETLVKETGQRLVDMIEIEREKLEEKMAINNEKANQDGEKLVAESLASYNENMKTVIGKEDNVFTDGHERFKRSTIDLISITDKFPNEIYRNNFLGKLKSHINESHKICTAIHHSKKHEFKLNNGTEKIKKKFKTRLEALFEQSDDFITESRLEQESREQMLKSNNELIKLYDDDEDRITNEHDGVQDALKDLHEYMKSTYTHCLEIYRLRYSTSEAEAYTTLSKARNSYNERLSATLNACLDEDEFKLKAMEIHKETQESLLKNLKYKRLKKDLISKIESELMEDMNQQLKKHLSEFKAQQKRNDIVVENALYEARRNYDQQMEKKLKTKDWFEPGELSKLNDQLMNESISKGEETAVLNEIQKKQLREAMQAVYLKHVAANHLKCPVENPAIGIDLGTTYCCAAVVINGAVQIIPDSNFGDSTTIPSYVAFKSDHSIDIGGAAKLQAFRNPENTIFDAKTLIGRTLDDPIVQADMKLWIFTVVGNNNQPRIRVHGNNYAPEEISSKILFKIKQVAEKYLNREVKEAVVTVPAYFNNCQRQAIWDAAEMAGLKVRILNEPTAAAIAYQLHRAELLRRKVLVFDLGGGIFDVAVLEIQGKDIKVKSTLGDTHLGGEDFDNKMVDSILERVKSREGIDLARGRDSSDSLMKAKAFERLRRIRDQCESAKRILSSAQSTKTVIDMLDPENNFNLEEEFTRKEFEDLNMTQFERCIKIVEKTLEDAGWDKTVIDDVVLVGGSTRIPKVQELLSAFFDGKKQLDCTINADEAVARGAAVQAALMSNKQFISLGGGVNLSEVAPLSLGVELENGDLSVFIPKDTPVPCKCTKRFVTSYDYQTTVPFPVYEGEKKIAKDNNFLGKFEVKGIPKAPQGKEALNCTMELDEEGILQVTAVICSTGVMSIIVIERLTGRMSKAEIEAAKRSVLLNW